MYLCTPCVWCPQRPEGIRSVETRITDDCEPLGGGLGIKPQYSPRAISVLNH